MGKNASVVQTELAGISIAAKEIIGKGIAGKTIIICSDSRQALLTLNRLRVISGLVMECHESLAQASDGNNIILRWVKGHNRNKGNRIADQLARRAAGLRLLGPCDLFGLSTTTIAETVKCHSHTQTVRRWEEGPGCRLAKVTLRNLGKSASEKYFRITRKNLRLTV
uniref:Uncharacterized protein LOC114348543 n=1 Tax=Diabrotica virgifera virgifera TaxID=50390 RepID=A0A6P7HB47_DIAVI